MRIEASKGAAFWRRFGSSFCGKAVQLHDFSMLKQHNRDRDPMPQNYCYMLMCFVPSSVVFTDEISAESDAFFVDNLAIVPHFACRSCVQASCLCAGQLRCTLNPDMLQVKSGEIPRLGVKSISSDGGFLSHGGTPSHHPS